MRRGPTSVKVLSILGILFSAFGVLGILTAGVMLVASGFLPDEMTQPEIDNDLGYLIGSWILLAISLPLTLLLFFASVGSLSLKPWARRGMLIYAVITILQGVAYFLFTFFYVLPLMLSVLPPNDPNRIGVVGGVVIGVFGTIIGMVYPIFVICYFTRPHVVDAFRGVFPPSRYQEEDDDYEEDHRYRYNEDDWRRRYSDGESDQMTNRPGG
jgi:hypothetical protein